MFRIIFIIIVASSHSFFSSPLKKKDLTEISVRLCGFIKTEIKKDCGYVFMTLLEVLYLIPSVNYLTSKFNIEETLRL